MVMEKGYLKTGQRGGTQGITPDAKAFCLDPTTRVYILSGSKIYNGAQ